MKKSKIKGLLAVLTLLFFVLSNVSYSLTLTYYEPQKQLSLDDAKLLESTIIASRTSSTTGSYDPLDVTDTITTTHADYRSAPSFMPKALNTDVVAEPLPEPDNRFSNQIPNTWKIPQYNLPGGLEPRDFGRVGSEDNTDPDNSKDDTSSNTGSVVRLPGSLAERTHDDLVGLAKAVNPQTSNDDSKNADDSNNFQTTHPSIIDRLPEIRIDPAVIRPLLKPDLVVSAFSADTRSVRFGEAVTFHYTVENKGSATASFKVGFYDGVMYYSKTADHVSKTLTLAPGKSISLSFKYVYDSHNRLEDSLKDGLFYQRSLRPRLVADYNNQVAETDESNNVKTTVLWVKPGVVSGSSSSEETNTNQPPAVDLVIKPSSGTAPLTVYATPSSSDPDGRIIDYWWEISSSGPKGIATSSYEHGFGVPEKKSFVFEFPGVQTIKLTVRDDDHAETTIVKQVIVTDSTQTFNDNPVAQLSVSPSSGTAPLTVLVDGSRSYDTDGSLASWSLSVSGPGLSENLNDNSWPFVPMNYSITEPGQYKFVLTVKDNGGLSDTDVAYVTVSEDDSDNSSNGSDDNNNTDDNSTDDGENQLPVAVVDVTPSEGVAPLNVVIDGTNSHDDKGITDYSWIVTGPHFSYFDLAVQGTPGVLNLTFDEPGEYTVRLNVRDAEHETSVAYAYVTVSESSDDQSDEDQSDNQTDGSGDNSDDNSTDSSSNQPPVPTITVDPSTGEAPLNVTISGDLSYDPDGEIVTHSWVVTGPEGYNFVQAMVPGTPKPHNLTFEYPGNYSIDLIVDDNDGISQSQSVVVVVTGNDINNTTDETDTSDNTDNNSSTEDNSSEDNTDATDTSDDNSTSGVDPHIHGIKVKSVKADEATITWETDVAANSKVCYGTDDSALDDCEDDSNMLTEHEIKLSALDEKTKYYYNIKSCSEDAVCDEKGPYKFTTLIASSQTDSDSDTSADDDWDSFVVSNGVEPYQQTTEKPVASDKSQSKDIAPKPPAVEVVYQTQYIEVEEPVCKLKFLWWCLWKEWVTKKIPVPAVVQGSGVKFEI